MLPFLQAISHATLRASQPFVGLSPAFKKGSGQAHLPKRPNPHHSTLPTKLRRGEKSTFNKSMEKVLWLHRIRSDGVVNEGGREG